MTNPSVSQISGYQELNQPTQQAPLSTVNPNAQDVQMQILIELQIHTFLFCQEFNIKEDISQMRRDIAASIAY